MWAADLARRDGRVRHAAGHAGVFISLQETGLVTRTRLLVTLFRCHTVGVVTFAPHMSQCHRF